MVVGKGALAPSQPTKVKHTVERGSECVRPQKPFEYDAGRRLFVSLPTPVNFVVILYKPRNSFVAPQLEHRLQAIVRGKSTRGSRNVVPRGEKIRARKARHGVYCEEREHVSKRVSVLQKTRRRARARLHLYEGHGVARGVW